MRTYKKIIFSIILLFAIALFSNYSLAINEICLNPQLANVTCKIVTPTIVCNDYTYDLFDNNGNLLNTGNLTVYNDTATSYYFLFNEDVGTYYIRICDGSTRQIIVQGDNMIGFTPLTWILIVLIGMFLLFLWLSFKAHPIFMCLSGLIMMYFAFYFHSLYGNWFITVILGLIGLILIFIGMLGSLSSGN